MADDRKNQEPEKYSNKRLDRLSTEPIEGQRSDKAKTNEAPQKGYYTPSSVQRPTKPKDK